MAAFKLYTAVVKPNMKESNKPDESHPVQVVGQLNGDGFIYPCEAENCIQRNSTVLSFDGLEVVEEMHRRYKYISFGVISEHRLSFSKLIP